MLDVTEFYFTFRIFSSDTTVIFANEMFIKKRLKFITSGESSGNYTLQDRNLQKHRSLENNAHVLSKNYNRVNLRSYHKSKLQFNYFNLKFFNHWKVSIKFIVVTDKHMEFVNFRWMISESKMLFDGRIVSLWTIFSLKLNIYTTT